MVTLVGVERLCLKLFILQMDISTAAHHSESLNPLILAHHSTINPQSIRLARCGVGRPARLGVQLGWCVTRARQDVWFHVGAPSFRCRQTKERAVFAKQFQLH